MQLKRNNESNYNPLFIVTNKNESNHFNVIQLPIQKQEKVISNTEKTRNAFYQIKKLLSENHPELFQSKKMPLAHDIREQILDAYP